MRVDYFRDRCPSAALIWPASRVLCGVHWDWNHEHQCYETYRYTRDAQIIDNRVWTAGCALSSFLRAVREDDRLSEPLIRLLALYVTMEYLASVNL